MESPIFPIFLGLRRYQHEVIFQRLWKTKNNNYTTTTNTKQPEDIPDVFWSKTVIYLLWHISVYFVLERIYTPANEKYTLVILDTCWLPDGPSMVWMNAGSDKSITGY